MVRAFHRWLIVVGCCVLMARSEPGMPSMDLETYVDAYVMALPGRGSEALQLPSGDEASIFSGAVKRLGEGDVEAARDLVTPLGYAVQVVRDSQDGRTLAVLREVSFEPSVYRGWGLFVVSLEKHSPLTVQVTHPVHDVGTAPLGVEAFRYGKAGLLSVAGTHRYANDDGTSDTAHEESTMLAQVDQALTAPSAIVVQPHGFDSESFPDYGDVVVSDGDAPPALLTMAAADALEREGFDVCLYDGSQCAGLAATSNVQGVHAREVGAAFVHLEVTREIRDDTELSRTVIRSTLDALLR